MTGVLEHGLVDELHLRLFPVIAGSGQRILEGLTTHLTPAGTTTFSSGIVVAVHEPKSDAM